MKRAAALGLLALLLLLAGAFLLHREPRAESPARVPRVAEPEPVPAAPPRIETAESPEPPTKAPIVSVLPPVVAAPPPPGVLPPAPPGIVRGSVKYLGERPKVKVVPMNAVPQCAALMAGPVVSDDLVLAPDGGVQWVFVFVKSGINGQPPPPPKLAVTIDQVGCMYAPHLAGVQVGQPLRILNSDPLLHNVHGLPFENREFNVGLAARGTDCSVTFTKPEVMIQVRCDVHPWMKAWVGVLDHPYFSVTDGTGSYGIPALPPGRYVLEAWHEKFVSVRREVDVTADADVVVDFLLDAKK